MGTRAFRMPAALAVCALLLWIGWKLMNHGPPIGSAIRGKTAYSELSCSVCHGDVGQGIATPGGGPKLVPNPLPLDAFAQQLRKPRLNMPIYPEERASDQDVADIRAYLLSIQAEGGPVAAGQSAK